jgi:prepilin-type N-terminal cleavage/methylation domain-containing protein
VFPPDVLPGIVGKADMKKQKGFSLVELLIVIALISIFAMIGVNSWQRYVTNANLRSATRDVASDILLCKEKAVSESKQYQITFNSGANTYTIGQWNSGTSVFDIIQTKTPLTFGPGNSILDTTFAGNTVTFLPRGTISGGLGSVRLTNTRNSTATVTINITGKTRVEFTMQ